MKAPELLSDSELVTDPTLDSEVTPLSLLDSSEVILSGELLFSEVISEPKEELENSFEEVGGSDENVSLAEVSEVISFEKLLLSELCS